MAMNRRFTGKKKAGSPAALFLHGPCGVGKSTLGRAISRRYGYWHVDAAPFKRMFSLQRSAIRTEIGEKLACAYAKELIARHFCVVIEDINRSDASILRSVMKNIGYKIGDVSLVAPVEQCIKNDKKRGVHGYGEKVIREIYSKYLSKEGYVIDVSNKTRLDVLNEVERHFKRVLVK